MEMVSHHEISFVNQAAEQEKSFSEKEPEGLVWGLARKTPVPLPDTLVKGASYGFCCNCGG